jgi:hypothetical protein
MRTRVRLPASAACVVGTVAAGVIALLVKAQLFPLMSGDADESVYIYQGRMLADGDTTLASAVHAEFLHPWLFGERGATLFSQYQPGWPAVIAFGQLLGNERVALVIAACAVAAATWWLAREVAPRAAPYAACLFLVSPIFVIHSGLFLSYLWTTALVTAGAAAALAGLRTRHWFPYVVSGALLGAAQLTRPLDALLVAALVAIYVVAVQWQDRRAWLRAGMFMAIGLAPLLLVTLVYNAHITGDPLHFPLQAAEPLDTFGFGPRRMAAGEPTLDYTRRVAWEALQDNASLIPRFFAGSFAGLALAAGALVAHRRKAVTWLLLAWIAVFPIAYIFWWATTLAAGSGRGGLGPHYYVPIFAPLAVLAGWCISDLVRRSRVLGLGALAAVLIVTAFPLARAIDDARLVDDMQHAKHEPFAATDLENAVVVLRADPAPYLFVNATFLIGNPDLTGERIYAVDRGPATAGVQDQFPDRTLYQYVLRAEPGDELLEPTFLLEQLEIERGSSVVLPFAVTNTSAADHAVVSVVVGDRTVVSREITAAAGTDAGVAVDVALVAPGGTPPPARPGLLVAEVPDDATVHVRAAFGPTASADDGEVVERRYYAARRGDELLVQRPGLHFRRYRSDGEVWAAQNVDVNLRER